VRVVPRTVKVKLAGSVHVHRADLTHEVITVGTNGQTEFSIVGLPLSPATAEVLVNGVQYGYGVDFMIDGHDLEWFGAFDLATTDRLEIFFI